MHSLIHCYFMHILFHHDLELRPCDPKSKAFIFCQKCINAVSLVKISRKLYKEKPVKLLFLHATLNFYVLTVKCKAFVSAPKCLNKFDQNMYNTFQDITLTFGMQGSTAGGKHYVSGYSMCLCHDSLRFSALDGRFMTRVSSTNFCLQPLSLTLHRTC